jgi:hypothetical protein
VGDINLIGILISTLVMFASGFAWFNGKTFFPVWWKLMGKGDTQPGDNGGMVVLFGGVTVGIIVQATMLELLLDALRNESGYMGSLAGAGWAFLAAMLMAAAALGHRLFAGHGFRVWLIEVGNDVLNFVVVGAILGAFN